MTSIASATGTPTPDSPAPFHLDDRVLTITVSTSAAGTSLWREGFVAATSELRAVARDERDVRAILLVGAGKNFCAGGNVAAFAAAPDRTEYLRDLADDFHAFIGALYEAQRPIVAAVHGWASGAGMSITLHADVTVGGPSTKLRPAYPGIGLSPDGGLTWTLPRLVGPNLARAIILTDRVIDADEAVRLGLLTEIVDDDAIADTARRIAVDLANGPRHALRAARALLNASADCSLTAQLSLESQSISRLSGLPEGIEGVDAFLAKRRPDYPSVP